MCSAILLYWRNSDAESLGNGFSAFSALAMGVASVFTTGGSGTESSPLGMDAMFAGFDSCGDLELLVKQFLLGRLQGDRGRAMRAMVKNRICFIRQKSNRWLGWLKSAVRGHAICCCSPATTARRWATRGLGISD
jgi:hypothetical protein